MSDDRSELDAIVQRYRRRKLIVPQRYSMFSHDVMLRTQERQRVMLTLLAHRGICSLAGLDIVEVGCGTGANLSELLWLGADPARLTGNELQGERLAVARSRLPEVVRLHEGDAREAPVAVNSSDVVLQSTVFSSILDDDVQQGLADAMWRWVKPGGGVLWYDFTFDNPRNPDVRGVPLTRVRELFPHGRITARRITLAPPIARALCRMHPALYSLANAVPLLRTHMLGWILKPL